MASRRRIDLFRKMAAANTMAAKGEMAFIRTIAAMRKNTIAATERRTVKRKTAAKNKMAVADKIKNTSELRSMRKMAEKGKLAIYMKKGTTSIHE